MDSIESNEKSGWAPRIFSGRSSAALFSRTSSPSPSPSPKVPGVSEVEVPSADKARSRFLQSQQTIRIHYNAKKIGARDALRYYEQWIGQKIHLAPPALHPSLAVGATQANRAFIIFLLTALITIPVVFFAWGPVDRQRLIYAHLSLAFSSVVQVIALQEFFPGQSI